MLGQVPLLCIVNFWNPVAAVGRATLEAVLRGELTNWSALSGEDRPSEVLAYNRPDLPRLPGTDRPGLRQVRTQEAMVAAVRANPNAIGIITWPLVNPAVKVLTIDGVNPAWTLEPLTPASLSLLDRTDADGTQPFSGAKLVIWRMVAALAFPARAYGKFCAD